MKNSGIYKIQSIIKPERIYIGSAIDMPHRWRTHLKELRGGYKKNKKLQNHFSKYGEADLIFSILLGCEKEYLIANEQFFLDSYKPCFNIAPKAGSMLGYKFSEESKQKNSEKHKGKIPWNKGIKATLEACLNQSKSHMGLISGHKGKPHSIEAKLRMSRNRKGKLPSEDTKRNMSLAHKGKPIPEETKLRMWAEKKGIYPGKKMSDEFKQKIKDSWVVRKRKNEVEKLLLQTSLN